MSRNTYQFLSPENAVLLANQIHSVIGPEQPSDFGVSASQMTALVGAAGGLNAKNAAVVAAKAAYHAAVEARDAGDAVCKEAIASVAATVYATKTVTPNMVRAIGLQPRATTRTKIVPTMPTGVVAKIQEDRNVRLSWKRGANAAGVIFRIEAQASPDGEWAFAGETTATKIALAGYLPGEATSFRVVAAKNGLEAPASDVVSIYPAPALSAKPTLRLAA